MVAGWTLLGFGFGNLAMLGWLAAAAAPLLIHLWSRRRYREVPWAAVTFLLAAVRKHSRRIQFEQWLLLAVRTLLILFVVLAVAEPYGEQVGGGFGGAPTHRVLVIDTSFSLAYRGDESTRLAHAKKLAAELVDQSGPSDAFTLIAFANPPRQLVGREVIDRQEVAQRIDALTATDGPANLPATLELVAAALTLTPSDAQRFERQEVHFYSDLQRSTWEPEAISTEELRALVAAMGERASLRLVDVGSADAMNLAIVDLRTSEPFVTVDRPVTFDATLREFGAEARSGVQVDFLIDDVPVGQQTVDVPGGGEVAVRFTHRFRDPGSHVANVRVSGDRLDVDNIRWLAVPVKERVNVLCVGGSVEDARYLADALAPEPDASPIAPTIITEGELAETELAGFDCVFLSNVAQLTSDEAARLDRYVREGGGLAVFLGVRVLGESYNAASEEGKPLLPARLGEVAEEARFGLDPRDYRHPIVAPFRGRERAGLLSTPISRYFRLELPEADASRTVEVALAAPNGDPLIVTAPLGRGRVVLVATAGSMSSIDAASGRPWTTWPAWPSFLPIVREVLAYAVGGQQRAWQSTVGDPLILAESADRSGDSFSIVRPDGQKAEVRTSDSTNGRPWTYGDTNRSGVYTVRGGGGAETHFAVNVDTRESDLAPADLQELPPELLMDGSESQSAVIAGGGWQRSAWQRSLLWSAFALVLLELFLAWRFGRGST